METLDGQLFAHGEAGTNCVILPPGGDPITYNLVLSNSATNNQAEYEALITGLLIAKGARAKSNNIFCNSQLVVEQVIGEYAINEERFKLYGKG